MKRRSLDVIRVFQSPGDAARGRLVAGPISVPCALGRGGRTLRKREGDGATPTARMTVLSGCFRPDRLPRPACGIRLHRTRPGDGWCDDPASPLYNRPVRLPFAPSHETLWRSDGVYDVVLDLSWNRIPILRGRGSAIFLHLARPGYRPTEGCIALAPYHLRHLLARIGPRTRIVTDPTARPVRADQRLGRSPKIAVPTRTWVAPSWMAAG